MLRRRATSTGLFGISGLKLSCSPVLSYDDKPISSDVNWKLESETPFPQVLL